MQKSRLLYWLTPKRATIAAVTLVLLQLSFLLLEDRSIILQGATSTESLGAPVSDSPVFHNGPARYVAQQLANLTEAYTSHAVNSSVGLVLASLRTDDLTWLLDYCHGRWGTFTLDSFLAVNLWSQWQYTIHLHHGKDSRTWSPRPFDSTRSRVTSLSLLRS